MVELTPATDLAVTNSTRHPNESDAYREACQELLVEEIELRRHGERVAELRRHLPPGGEVPADYSFVGEDGADVRLSELFGDHDTLVVYSYMFGSERESPCPMRTSLLGGFDHKIADIGQRVAIVHRPVTDRAPDRSERVRGWTQLPVYSDRSGDYTRAFVSADDDDTAGYNVFTRRDGTIRHFWGDEISVDMADPDQDPRSAVEMDPALAVPLHRSGRPQHRLAPEPDVRIELIPSDRRRVLPTTQPVLTTQIP